MANGGHKIKVLVVDDSALIRRLLTAMLEGDPALCVVGAAKDPFEARELIKLHSPDVLTLDVEMPRMDGIQFLRQLMRLHPMPVVMVSTLTEKGAQVTLEALAMGAVDFVAKPRLDVERELSAYAEEIIEKVKAAAASRPRPLQTAPRVAVPPRMAADAVLGLRAPHHLAGTSHPLVAIGASTGGTEAIAAVVRDLPPDSPAMVITQHMPVGFTAAFARRLDANAQVSVCEAVEGQQILPGHAYLAPGGVHLLVERNGARLVCRLHEGPPVNRHKPSVDVLFRSVASSVGSGAVGVLLTGMGDDGARGLHELRATGARVIVQDEESSVVWGMPGAAVKLGKVDAILPLDQIPAALLRLSRR